MNLEKEGWKGKLFSWTGRSYYVQELKRAYQFTFGDSPGAQLVLKDIADFTRAYHINGTFDPNPYEHARLEGRREVWQRIMNHLHISEEKLMMLYQNNPINLGREE